MPSRRTPPKKPSHCPWTPQKTRTRSVYGGLESGLHSVSLTEGPLCYVKPQLKFSAKWVCLNTLNTEKSLVATFFSEGFVFLESFGPMKAWRLRHARIKSLGNLSEQHGMVKKLEWWLVASWVSNMQCLRAFPSLKLWFLVAIPTFQRITS